MSAYVFKTTNYGDTWTALADRNITAYCYKILEDLVKPELLFLGTEFGLFISIDGGSSWTQFKGELPNVSVMDMVIHPREHDLVLGTHGRGVYIIDDITPLRQLSPQVLESDFTFLESRPAVPMNVTGDLWPDLDDEFKGKNPPAAVPVTFYMKKRHIFGKMSIEILDEKDESISEVVHVSRKGINRAYWSPVMPPPRSPRTEALPFQMLFALQGPDYPAGEYKVRVTKGRDVYESSVRVHRNPDLACSDEDLLLRRKTAMKGYNLLEDLAYLDRRMNDVIGQTSVLTDSPSVKNSVKNKIQAMNDELESVKDRLMVRKFGDLRGDAELREEAGFLYGTVLLYPGRPTHSQISGIDQLAVKADAMTTEVDAIFSRYLDGINRQLEKAGMEPVKITTREEFDAGKE